MIVHVKSGIQHQEKNCIHLKDIKMSSMPLHSIIPMGILFLSLQSHAQFVYLEIKLQRVHSIKQPVFGVQNVAHVIIHFVAILVKSYVKEVVFYTAVLI